MELKARIYNVSLESGDDASSDETFMCTGSVHVRGLTTWYAVHDRRVDKTIYEVLGPCDGSCTSRIIDLPREAIKLVKKFKVRGERWRYTEEIRDEEAYDGEYPRRARSAQRHYQQVEDESS